MENVDQESEYAVVPLDDGARIVLPLRERGPRRMLYGVLLLIGGILLLGVTAVVSFHLLHIHLLIWGLFFSFGVMGAGVRLIWPGHAEVAVRGNTVTVSPSGRGKKEVHIDAEQIARLEIDASRSSAVIERKGKPTGPTLLAEMVSGARVELAADYPRAMLERLAADLLPLISAARQGVPAGEHDAPAMAMDREIQIVDVSNIPPIKRDVLRQPITSKIRAAKAEGVSTYLVGRTGAFRSVGTLIVVMVLLTALALLDALFMLGMVLEKPNNRPEGWGVIMMVAGAVLLVTMLLMLLAMHAFSRKTILVATADSLVKTTRGILGSRERAWSVEQVRAVSTDQRSSSGTFTVSAASKLPVRLYVVDDRGRKRRLADGEEFEMRWLATELRAALGVGRD